jgi:D-alanyl-D-alanine endopeptidase (penicillin-binding protein 7)
MKKTLLYTLIAIANINTAYGTTTTTTKHKKHHIHKKHSRKSQSISKVASVASTMSSPPISGINASGTKINMDKIDMQSVANQPRLYSYAALAVDANTGEILVSKNPHTKMPIASISKLMTAMVMLDSGANLDEYITISSDDIDTLRNTSSRLRVGMQLKRRDLLLLALMSSENRAAFALGRTAYPGGIKVFIKKMNEKAISLGMNHTQFYDPTGLTNANQSTAEDLAKMVQAAFGYEQIRQDTTTKGADVQLGKNYVHHYMNSDALVRAGRLQIALSKTGFINEAGHCLVLYSLVDKQPIIMVFLNSAGKSGRLLDAIAVKNYLERS